MFGGEPLPCAGEAGLDFVGDEEDAVLAADFLQDREIIARRDDEATFTKNGFGDYGSYGFGSYCSLKGVFQIVGEGFGGGGFFRAVRIGERDAVDVAGERLEAGFVGMGFAGESHSQESAAMESVFEANYGGTFGVDAGDLDGVFDGFGAAIEERGFFGEFAGSKRVEFFGYGDVVFVGSDGEAEM